MLLEWGSLRREEALALQPILIIGYGNTLRGDDGFGPLAARLLEERQIPGLEIIISHQLNPELSASLAEARFAVFLDATDGSKPGALAVAAVEPRDIGPSGATHNFEPGTLLALSKAVYGRAPAAALITASARSFEHGEEISAEVRAAAIRAAEAIASLAASGQLACETLSEALRRE
ncbi:MAG: hydrogenase maturation protease [Candidatus Korobacteraceae bacterium]|jgi:hydrogenase maturation protease